VGKKIEKVAWCHHCDGAEVVYPTDCCDQIMPACITVQHQDGTVECRDGCIKTVGVSA